MKLGKDALLEIILIIQNALVQGEDASQKLRELDLVIKHGIPEVEGGTQPDVGKLVLSDPYRAANPRQNDFWTDEGAEA